MFVVALSLWLAGCNSQPPAARGLPAAEVTVSKPVQKEILNWAEFTGRVAAVKFVKRMFEKSCQIKTHGIRTRVRPSCLEARMGNHSL